ncbi:MAG: hypothetical protein COW19_08280 [Zetaproteobacteria bacterium CG12_big_fil_rev_8_21_14_0_65_55_1124]|nr:MAG: hypothetical protein AUJ58_03750 [Zetaproteobacteria bacterium CG1_02_55_237]PIS20317.1 MAG: hypothetical protein COT53_00885 [Zetaproteobacteria bacterium CG08_land_8_20_14_0_20_55_17]PIW42456.1 MAG: hypothetical protein COW19_08280 [Zetaproteobacteria bacterium CG12_big_fil_rev_8_21_14_0_65_55_1124]PIY52319.1 MAG: hypothetical protein COZ01_07925 [Zetaproteobacteria bacterium CG_4_10_14_0_8_um_filter_55_43]PIZ37098.1 MAG: hypothetical protein COY36_10025 [Zetaproteobacteria bacterium 
MNLKSYLLLTTLLCFWSSEAMAVDSYRYLHVTIDTPWMIFVFLFFLVFAPMILSAIIHLRNAMRGDKPEERDVRGGGDETGTKHD